MPVPVVDVDSLSRNWWAVSLRGLAGILFGIITFIAPGISLAALVLLFALGLRLKGLGSPRHRGQPAPGVA